MVHQSPPRPEQQPQAPRTVAVPHAETIQPEAERGEQRRDGLDSASSQGGGKPAHETDYFAELRYPPKARRRRQEGVVHLRFVMDKQGHVVSYEIASSSGHSVLDAEVKKLIRRAEPLPRPPDRIVRASLELVVPVEFSLKRR